MILALIMESSRNRGQFRIGPVTGQPHDTEYTGSCKEEYEETEEIMSPVFPKHGHTSN